MSAHLPLLCMTMSADRRFEGSSEIFLRAVTDLHEFWIALGTPETGQRPLAHLRFERYDGRSEIILGQCSELFGLREVRPGNASAPSPIVSLSSVLWRRRAALEAHQAICAYQAGLDQIPQSSDQSEP